MRAPITKIWTPEHVTKLEKLLDAGASATRAASALNRSIVSVQEKARKLGRPFPRKRDVKRQQLQREADKLSRS